MNKPLSPIQQRANVGLSSPGIDDSVRLQSVLARTLCRVHELVPGAVRSSCQDGGCPKNGDCLKLARKTLSYARDIEATAG